MNKYEQNDRLQDIIETLRAEQSDNRQFEVKTAAKGFPETAVKTISAFANTPGGGTLIFGVDENQYFTIIGVYDPKQCQQTLAAYAKREFSAPIAFKSELSTANGKYVVIADILESDKSLKPVKVRKTGKAYIRMYDSDFELSSLEEQIFIANRGITRFDEDSVPNSSVNDLNKTLLSAYIADRKARSSVLAGMADEDVLLRTGVMTAGGQITVTGILALGIYPQQYFPNYSIQASLRKSSVLSDTVRAANIQVFDGPIPVILENTCKWVAENSLELTRDMPDGMVSNIMEYPPVTVRELVANSLIHRDLNPLSMTQNISLIIDDNGLVISNPGGLYGISISELGRTASVTRNVRLAEICQFVPTNNGSKIIEKLGSGIPKIFSECDKYGSPHPDFFDGGIYFTVKLPTSVKTVPGKSIVRRVNVDNTDFVLLALTGSPSPLSKTDIEQKTGLTPAQVRYALKKLIERDEVRLLGKKGDRDNKYIRLNDN